MRNESRIINMTGSMCPAASDAEFNKWYDDVHIAKNMRYPGLVGVTRYQLVRFSDWVEVKRYPRYLTMYEFADMEAFRDWNVSLELTQASVGVPELMKRLGIEMVWRVQYEPIQSWGKTESMSVITFMGSDCSPEFEARYDKWARERHIPRLLKASPLEGIRRYRVAGQTSMGVKNVGRLVSQVKEYPRFLTVHYFRDTAAADAYDVDPVRAREIEKSQEMIKEAGISQVWRAQYSPIASWSRQAG